MEDWCVLKKIKREEAISATADMGESDRSKYGATGRQIQEPRTEETRQFETRQRMMIRQAISLYMDLTYQARRYQEGRQHP